MAKYFDKNAIVAKIQKLYESGKVFEDFMQDADLFPLEIGLKKLKQKELQSDFTQVLRESQLLLDSDIPLTCKDFEFKNIGRQTLPVSANFRSRSALLSLIHKEQEFADFTLLYKRLTCKYPALKFLFLQKTNLIVRNLSLWDKLIKICDFFVKNPQPRIYIRELSIEGIDTKFVEKNRKILDLLLAQILSDFDKNITSLSEYGFEKKYHLRYPLPQVRFRILDENIFISGLSDITISIEDFQKLKLTCKHIFIVENKITTLSFPVLKDSIVIFGSGYGVQVLKDVGWFEGKNLYYWGDIDTDGFAILSQIRGYFPDIKSLFMDKKTVDNFQEFSVKIETKKAFKVLENLHQDEYKLYQEVYQEGLRLEQERINFSYIKEELYASVRL